MDVRRHFIVFFKLLFLVLTDHVDNPAEMFI